MRAIWKFAAAGTMVATVAATTLWAVKEPMPYAFLEKYEIVSKTTTENGTTLILRTDVQPLIAEAEQFVDPMNLVVQVGEFRFCKGWAGLFDDIQISDNLNEYLPKDHSLHVPGLSTINYKRQYAPWEVGWRWVRDKLDPGYREREMFTLR